MQTKRLYIRLILFINWRLWVWKWLKFFLSNLPTRRSTLQVSSRSHRSSSSWTFFSTFIFFAPLHLRTTENFCLWYKFSHYVLSDEKWEMRNVIMKMECTATDLIHLSPIQPNYTQRKVQRVEFAFLIWDDKIQKFTNSTSWYPSHRRYKNREKTFWLAN